MMFINICTAPARDESSLNDIQSYGMFWPSLWTYHTDNEGFVEFHSLFFVILFKTDRNETLKWSLLFIHRH